MIRRLGPGLAVLVVLVSALLPGCSNEKPGPAQYKVLMQTSRGDVTIEVTRAWAPRGADRFYQLVKDGFFDGAKFFRVIRSPEPFMAQFGINADPKVTQKWENANIQDDPVTQSNTRGMVSFAMSAKPNSRSTQLFINYGDNVNLDRLGFSPIGKVTKGMEIVDQFYADYGEGAPDGAGPDQGRIEAEGNAYLDKEFPKLDYIKTAKIME